VSLPRLFCRPLTEGELALSPEESHHVATVLRCKPAQVVTLFDGKGREAAGAIKRLERRKVWVSVDVAMPKPHRQGYLIEKCTELGAAAIWPIIAEHSVSRPRASTVEKWERRAIEAAKQAGRAWVPTVERTCDFTTCLQRAREFDAVSIACPAPDATPVNTFLQDQRDGAVVLVLVGPEGGWSEPESKAACAGGAVPTSLGPTVLRTETAAVAFCAAAAAFTARGSRAED